MSTSPPRDVKCVGSIQHYISLIFEVGWVNIELKGPLFKGLRAVLISVSLFIIFAVFRRCIDLLGSIALNFEV